MSFQEIVLTGTLTPEPEPIPLHCGPLTMRLEPTSGFLRGIRLGDKEILRGLYVAVRDRNWGTVAPLLSDLEVVQEEDSFQVTFSVDCRQSEIDFQWKGSIIGEPDGSVRYAMSGEARTTFLRNRIGFCVLHPIANCAGKDCTLETTDGETVTSQFPQLISPHQPFKNLRAIAYNPLPNVTVETRFQGDTFETEDQRNWTDASFKTYCTPLELPYPAEITAGILIEQIITLNVTNTGKDRPSMSAVTDGKVSMRIGGLSSVRKLPKVGLDSSDGRLTDRELDCISNLDLEHLRGNVTIKGIHLPAGVEVVNWEIHTTREDVEYTQDQYYAVSRNSYKAVPHGEIIPKHKRLRYEVAITLPPTMNRIEQVVAFSTYWFRGGYIDQYEIVRILFFHPEEAVSDSRWGIVGREELSRLYWIPFSFLSGTKAYFAELNRNRPDPNEIEGVCFSINPQVHAFDNDSLIENLAAQGEVVRTARALFGRKRIAVSPVTLRPRFNPNATGPEPETPAGELPPQVDPRQMSLFGAVWTLGSLKYLSEAGANSITYYETVGWRGVMEREEGSPLPDKFPSIPGGVFPLYHVFADVGEYRGGKVRALVSSDSLKVDAMFLVGKGKSCLLLGNMTRKPQTVTMRSLPLIGARTVRFLDASNAEFAMREPERYRLEAVRELPEQEKYEIELPPYAYVRIEGRTEE